MKKRHLKICVFALLLLMALFIVILLWIMTEWQKNFIKTDAPDWLSIKIHPSIHFLETSGKPVLTLREACSVESAALHNPNHTVQLHSIAPFRLNDMRYMQTLSRIANINLHIMHVSELLRSTPLSSWYSSGQIKKSLFPIHHLSDATRLAILWKLGGIYLDLDTITLRPLGGLTNTLGLQGSEDVASGALVFDKNSPFLNTCMAEFARDYRPKMWGFHGPVLVTSMLRRACNVTLLANAINQPEKCQGIKLLPMHYFLPVGWADWKLILIDNTTKFNLTDSYMVHLYGALSGHTKAKPMTGVLLDILAKENCPETYKWMLINNEL